MLNFYISSANFGEKYWLVIYKNANFTCSAAVCRISRQIVVNENLAQTHLKKPITVCMCFGHQSNFQELFCPALPVWCCGGLVCSQSRCCGRDPACRFCLCCCCRCLQVLHSAPCPLLLPCFSPLWGPDTSWGFPQQHKDVADNVHISLSLHLCVEQKQL